MEAPKSTKRRLVELDALRGIGAIAVVLYHFTTRFPLMFPKADHVPITFWEGEYRVLLFFAISGFAIFFTMDHLKSAPDFIVNRISRLFPAYWVAMCLTLAFVYAADIKTLEIPWYAALANVTMLQGYLYLPAVDGAYWTLTVEIGFYVSILAIWAAFGFRRLEPICLGWLMLKWLMLFWEGMPSRIAALLILDFVPFFIIGMLFYRIWAGHRRWTWQMPYLAAALLTVLGTDGSEWFFVGCGLAVIFSATLAGWLRFLCVGPLLWFGRISYSLYLVHENIGFVIMLKAHEAGLGHWAGFSLAFVSVIAIAWVLNMLVEKPGARMIAMWWKQRKSKDGLQPNYAVQPLS